MSEVQLLWIVIIVIVYTPEYYQLIIAQHEVIRALSFGGGHGRGHSSGTAAQDVLQG